MMNLTATPSMHDVIDASDGRIDADLYRDAEGHEVWRITLDGKTFAEGVASDHDAGWFVATLAESIDGGAE
ncbi:MAG TPA: hypothetical protein VMW08_00825 [Acidimicrobiales bacterium]|nr:hypothetical protein [Acidimicrobiales bacterium]